MNWLAWPFYCLTAFGLAFVVGQSKISLPFRVALAKAGPVGLFLVELLECPGCFGFWCGIAYSFTAHGRGLTLWAPPLWAGTIALGLFTCATNMVLNHYATNVYSRPQ